MSPRCFGYSLRLDCAWYRKKDFLQRETEMRWIRRATLDRDLLLALSAGRRPGPAAEGSHFPGVVFEAFRLMGERVIDPKDPRQVMVLEHVRDIPDDPSRSQSFSIENRDQLRRRLHPMLIITDNNMGTEWRG